MEVARGLGRQAGGGCGWVSLQQEFQPGQISMPVKWQLVRPAPFQAVTVCLEASSTRCWAGTGIAGGGGWRLECPLTLISFAVVPPVHIAAARNHSSFHPQFPVLLATNIIVVIAES